MLRPQAASVMMRSQAPAGARTPAHHVYLPQRAVMSRRWTNDNSARPKKSDLSDLSRRLADLCRPVPIPTWLSPRRAPAPRAEVGLALRATAAGSPVQSVGGRAAVRNGPAEGGRASETVESLYPSGSSIGRSGP